jgi:hypothetical protein
MISRYRYIGLTLPPPDIVVKKQQKHHIKGKEKCGEMLTSLPQMSIVPFVDCILFFGIFHSILFNWVLKSSTVFL